ncbi:MAG: alpha/beta hydrolase [Acidobacteria bacterium]|nr:alpha/beta hydrolase [Acidobacteriota bacterium]
MSPYLIRMATAWFLAGAMAAGAQAQPQPAAAGQLVDVGGGRRLHLHCTGAGSGPVVLYLNGLPRFSLHYSALQTGTAKWAKSCVYDRAGDAWSDAMPAGYTVDTMLADLDKIASIVSPSRPLVLAGHSFGGVLARAYTKAHPERVAALVLIDSSHHNWTAFMMEGKRTLLSEMTPDQLNDLITRTRTSYRPPGGLPMVTAPFDKLSPALQEAHLWGMRRVYSTSKADDVVLAMNTQWKLYSGLREVKFGDLPLVVISRPQPDAWVASQKDIAALSTRGKLVMAPGSGHDIELDAPQLVVDAIGELLGQLK